MSLIHCILAFLGLLPRGWLLWPFWCFVWDTSTQRLLLNRSLGLERLNIFNFFAEIQDISQNLTIHFNNKRPLWCSYFLVRCLFRISNIRHSMNDDFPATEKITFIILQKHLNFNLKTEAMMGIKYQQYILGAFYIGARCTK